MSVPAAEEASLDDIMIAIVPAHIQAQKLDLSINRLAALKNDMRMVFVNLKRHQNWENEKITEAHKDMVKELLWLYYKNLDLGIKFRKEPASVESVLSNIINPTFHLPDEIRAAGTALMAKFETFNWGIGEPEEQPITEPSKKRKILDRDQRNSIAGPSQGIYRPAPDDHWIFGLGLACMMHHIEISKGGKTKSYRIAPDFVPRDFRVFGNNGLHIGDCWAKQVAANRDGAHGPSIGGISGTEKDGVYSIIVSGKYADIDYDAGDEIYYATADAHTSTATTANRTNNGTRALLRSFATGNPIRVLRKSTSKWANAPRAGLRYDGLYTIIGTQERSNELGGKYLRFELERTPGQGEIAVDRPTLEEVRQIEKTKDGY